MRRRTLHPPHPFGKINVTPMIDVVMCLIVFYLIVGKLAADQRSNLRLPVSATGLEDKAQDVLIINIKPERIVIDAAEVAAEEIEGIVRQRAALKPGLVVELRGARELSYGSIAAVVRACKSAGVESVRLATEKAGR